MRYKRVITEMTGITTCLYIDGNDPVEMENLKVQEKGGVNCQSKCFGVRARGGIAPRRKHWSWPGARPGHHSNRREGRD